jgi:hypothetical protein
MNVLSTTQQQEQNGIGCKAPENRKLMEGFRIWYGGSEEIPMGEDLIAFRALKPDSTFCKLKNGWLVTYNPPDHPEIHFDSEKLWKTISIASHRLVSHEESDGVEKDAELEQIFNGLAKIWKEATGGLSTTARRFAHPTYKAILRLGPETVPFILLELRRQPDWWFDALEFLTKENPTKSTDSFEDAAAAWVKWGEDRDR